MMRISINSLLVSSILLLLIGCSQKQNSETKLVVSLGALTAEGVFEGGALLKLVNSTTNEEIDITLVAPYKASIPYGTWDLYLTGWDSPNWTGTVQCGKLTDVNFAEPQLTITILVNSSNCTGSIFQTMIASKTTLPVGVWGTGAFGQAKWGP